MSSTDEIARETAASLADDDGLTDVVALAGTRTRVTLTDGSSFVVRITNHCYLAWDKTAPKQKWGSAQDAPFLAQTYMCFVAAKRQGLTTLKFPEWEEAVDLLEKVEEDPEDAVRPTHAAPPPGT